MNAESSQTQPLGEEHDRPSADPAVIAQPASPTGNQMFEILACIGLVLFLIASTVGMLFSEIVSASATDLPRINEAEIAAATEKQKELRQEIKELQQETKTLRQLNSQRRERLRLARIEQAKRPAGGEVSTTSKSENANPSERQTVESFGVHSNIIYALMRGISWRHELGKLESDGEKSKVLQIAMRAYDLRMIRVTSLVELTQEIGDEENLRRVFQFILKYEDPKEASFVANGLFGLVPRLPEAERTAALLKTLTYCSRNATISDDISSAIYSTPASERHQLSRHLAHPNSEIRAALLNALPEADRWTLMTRALQGKDYGLFQVALQWLAQPEVNDSYRRNVLKGLSDVAGYQTAKDHDIVDMVCTWVDKESSFALDGVSRLPNLDTTQIDRLIGIASKLDRWQFIDGSSGKLQNELLRRFIVDETTAKKLVSLFLVDGKDVSLKLKWIQATCTQGDARHLPAMTAAVDKIQQQFPGSVVAAETKAALQKMNTRLGKGALENGT